MRIFIALLCFVVFAVSAPASAQQLKESYKALLSEKDHFNSNGERLRSAAAIIRQDRANFHRFGIRDSADQDDVFFEDVNNRAELEALIERGSSEPRAINRIVNGTPMVRVDIFSGPRGPFVNVTVLD
jgi:DnaJ-domain-containing protein 1